MKRFFQKLTGSDKAEFITVVSGLPRSGTSMMMKMLEAGGVPPVTDELRAADEDNPKGYYEFERVKLMDQGDTEWVVDARGKVIKVISALLKHLPPGEQYRVIFVRRNMPEILASQRKMLIRRGEDPDKMNDAQMAMLFEKHLKQIDEWLRAQPNFRVLYVHYSEVLADPRPHIAKINDFLGGTLDAAGMAEMIDPDLYRNRQAGRQGGA
ncbi:MAG: sulfotransferase [Candidatus Promineofilum sp.]|nr:sulfotransferase [Promineifilum sp.]